MSNRDYYGNYTPENLSSQDKTQQMGSMQNSEFLANQNHEQQLGEQNPYNQQNQWKDFEQGPAGVTPEGERGLGATVVGGAGGAFVGHHVGKKSDHGTLGAVGGALAGAVMANMASKAVKGSHHGHGSAHDRRRERLERRLDRLG
ncbi:uncharacterized protein N7496_011170 [Penicillium cataractarum]|uniref:Glycine zipper 2TM domain-containing protein n=1 Tax=Penicillium cataractarum TaxID=2100454 RepID=A0A9W9REY5_9EURO|nr:uncharacterized protein N7496_011170 [Penicillium cataractarum]KAJ5358757.1 hypothetical protein N7496_011170 [Penicillium cataractarum]